MAATALPANTQMGQTAVADPAGTAADATNGNTCTNSGATAFRLKNTVGSQQTVIFTTPVTVEGYAVADQTVTLPLSATQWVGRFDIKNFGARIVMLASNAGVLITAFEP
jgi:zona occludens toxin (predicted ATPase)